MFDSYLDHVVDNALGQGYACASQRSSTTDDSEASKASVSYIILLKLVPSRHPPNTAAEGLCEQ